MGGLIGDVGSIASPEFGSMRGFGSAIGQLSGRGGAGGVRRVEESKAADRLTQR